MLQSGCSAVLNIGFVVERMVIFAFLPQLMGGGAAHVDETGMLLEERNSKVINPVDWFKESFHD